MAFQRPFVISLKRSDSRNPWGFQVFGGREYSAPHVVQTVAEDSLAERCGLRAGDEVIQVGRINTQELSLPQLQELLIRCGNKIEMFVIREDLLTSRKGKEPPVVKAVVHNPYNSPLQLYSTENIADTLAKQTEVLTEGQVSTEEEDGPENLTFKQKSEVFKLLEEQSMQESPTVTYSRSSPQSSPVKKPTAAPPPPPKPKPPSSEHLYNGIEKHPIEPQVQQKRVEFQSTTEKVVNQHYYQQEPTQQTRTYQVSSQPSYQHQQAHQQSNYQQQNYQNCQQLNQSNYRSSQTYPQPTQGYQTQTSYQQQQFQGHQSPTSHQQQQHQGYQSPTSYQQQHLQGQQSPNSYPQQFQGPQSPNSYQQQQFQGYQYKPTQGHQSPTVGHYQPTQGPQSPTVNYQQSQQSQSRQQQQHQSQQHQSQQHQSQQQQRSAKSHTAAQKQQKSPVAVSQAEFKIGPPPPPRASSNQQQKSDNMTAVYRQQYEQHLQQQHYLANNIYDTQTASKQKPVAHLIKDNIFENNAESGTPITYKAPPAAPPKPAWPPASPQQNGQGSRGLSPSSPPSGLKNNIQSVWPPKQPSVRELPRTGFNPAAVREQSTGRRCVWPPPKDEDSRSGRDTPQSPATGRKINWNPSPSPPPNRRNVFGTSHSPARRKDIAWPPPAPQTNLPRDGQTHRPSPRLSRKARFDDYVKEHAANNIPSTYRAPPGTQHVEYC